MSETPRIQRTTLTIVFLGDEQEGFTAELRLTENLNHGLLAITKITEDNVDASVFKGKGPTRLAAGRALLVGVLNDPKELVFWHLRHPGKEPGTLGNRIDHDDINPRGNGWNGTENRPCERVSFKIISGQLNEASNSLSQAIFPEHDVEKKISRLEIPSLHLTSERSLNLRNVPAARYAQIM